MLSNLEKKKKLNKEAYELLKQNTKDHEIQLRTKYKSMIQRQMELILNSPKEENRLMQDKISEIKERALQRTIQLNLEIKKNSDWTMPKLVENVIYRKEKVKEDKLKEIEQKRIAKALRHQLAHQSVVSSVGKWLTLRLSSLVKEGK
jgi:hypothetical protein